MDATEWTATLACTPPSPLGLPLISRPRALACRLFPVLSTLFPSPCAPREMVGWAGSGLHPRSHLFIIKFHVYRQPVRWRSEFLSECVHTRPRGGKRGRRHGETHMHARARAHTRVCMHIRVNGHIDECAREFEGGFFRLSLSHFLFLPVSLPIARGSGKARIRSAVNLKINIDRGAANPLFIDADCWLHGRDAPRRLLLSPFLPPTASPRFPLPCCSKRVLNNAVILVTVPL